jgi:hypothetical protein
MHQCSQLPATQANIYWASFFNDLKEIRDQCAHPGGEEELIPPPNFSKIAALAAA